MRLVQFVEGFTTQFPQLSVEFYGTAAEGDLVVTHSLRKTSPEDHAVPQRTSFAWRTGSLSSTGTSCSPYRRAQRTSPPCPDGPCDSGDAGKRPVPGRRDGPYSPKCLEGAFSEVPMQDAAQYTVSLTYRA
jgi:hypothetical protein